MLSVSTSVELAVGQVTNITAGVVLNVAAVVAVALLVVQVLVTVTVVDVDTALDIEYTVVVTVGPSGCLNLPTLLPPYSANQMFTGPVEVSL